MNPEYNPVIAAELIESAHPRKEHEACDRMWTHATDSAMYFMASSDRFERNARRWKAAAFALLGIVGLLVVRVVGK